MMYLDATDGHSMSDADATDHGADDLLRRALIDAEASAAVALSVGGLPVSDEVTVIFHGRRDLGTIQTYVAPGHHGAGDSVGAAELLRVPCDLDLADAEDRAEAERPAPACTGSRRGRRTPVHGTSRPSCRSPPPRPGRRRSR
jgi:hypothetical protein